MARVKTIIVNGVKYNLTLRGALKDFVETLSTTHFHGNMSKAILYCVDYCMARDKSYNERFNLYSIKFPENTYEIAHINRYLCSKWFDLPKSRIGDVIRDMNEFYLEGSTRVIDMMDTRKITINLSDDEVEFLDYYVKEKSKRKTRDKKKKDVLGIVHIVESGKEIKCLRYPQLQGMRRNAIYQCIYMTMYDTSIMAMNGQAMTGIKDLEKYYSVEVR
jgi:hypothetical protein